jgi:cation-transporting ATPase 13A2
MLSLIGLTAFNLMVLLSPPEFFTIILELMRVPFEGRTTMLVAVIVNVALSFAFEAWGTQVVAHVLDWASQFRRDSRRVRDGKAYKAIDGAAR